MHSKFRQALSGLFDYIKLEAPADLSEMVTLDIDGQQINITEHPENTLLMFSTVETAQLASMAELFKQNQFTDDPLRPLLGQTEDSEHWLLWSRQSLNDATTASLYHQLEQLSDRAETLFS